MERADRLTAPPVVGRFYLVHTVTAKWHGIERAWPVIGPQHSDAEFFDFKSEHYHIDGRFLSDRLMNLVEVNAPWRTPESELQAAPLHDWITPPKPVLARRRCRVAHIPYEHDDKKPIIDLRSHFAGAQCERGKAGWICPHRKASLGSVVAIDGVITCPLHGLRIDAATGRTLAPAPPSPIGIAESVDE